ncbi:hypothetical protein DWZ14_20475 [Enterocloster citroniae]|nr:hypothetical protein DWZ14_20475 [Enterocloster citroniae]
MPAEQGVVSWTKGNLRFLRYIGRIPLQRKIDGAAESGFGSGSKLMQGCFVRPFFMSGTWVQV